MNITLSADAALIRAAREYAARHSTTLNQIVRDFLTRTCAESDAADAATEFAENATRFGGKSEAGFRFDRAAIHERVLAVADAPASYGAAKPPRKGRRT